MIQILRICLTGLPFLPLVVTHSSLALIGDGSGQGAALDPLTFGVFVEKQRGFAMKFEETQKVDQRRYPVTMHFRCSKDEADTIRRRAAETGNSVSAFLRKRAIGGKTSQPIQDLYDLAELRQHMGLLKQLVTQNRDFRPLLKDIENLILKMAKRAG